jgi:hypothetical protein
MVLNASFVCLLHSRFVEDYPIWILKDGPLISEVVLSHMSSLSINFGISGFEGIVFEVVASLVTSLKWASYDLLLLLDSFMVFWYNSIKCLGGVAFSSKIVWTTTFMVCKYLAFAIPLTFGLVLHILVVAFVFLEFTKFLVMIVGSITSFITLHIIVNL